MMMMYILSIMKVTKVHNFLDTTRSFMHEIVHALTNLQDEEENHPRGPVVEYTQHYSERDGASFTSKNSLRQQ
ncbi:PipA [Salmonella enterica subsp. arizonae]|nr:PipA [Salmonella enterica subsp. arizonae]